MTAQAYERIIFNGEEHLLASEPLSPYLNSTKFKFHWTSTGCWRGYIGHWSLENGELHLIDLTDTMQGDVGVSYLFPNENKVKATWFTGKLRIPQGEMLSYTHAGFASVFERDVFIEIAKGNVLSVDEQNNEAKEEEIKPLSKKEIRANKRFWKKYMKRMNRVHQPESFWKVIKASIQRFLNVNNFGIK